MLRDYWEFISKLSEEYGKYRRAVMDRFDMPAVEVDVIMFLANNRQYNTAAEVVRAKHIPKSHVSLAVKGLIARGYLTGEPMKSGRNKIKLDITDAAAPMIEFGRAMQREFVESLFAGFSESERDEYRSYCGRIISNITHR